MQYLVLVLLLWTGSTFIADAGPTQYVAPNSMVKLDANKSLIGFIYIRQNIKYNWELITEKNLKITFDEKPKDLSLDDFNLNPNNDIKIQNPDSPQATFIAPLIPGKYKFNLNIQYNEKQSSAITYIIVRESNLTANAGEAQLVAPQTICTLNALTSTDSEQLPISYFWEPDSNNPAVVELSSTTDACPTFSVPNTNGTYQFFLTINNKLKTSTASVDIYVSDFPILASFTHLKSPFYTNQTIILDPKIYFANNIQIPFFASFRQATSNPEQINLPLKSEQNQNIISFKKPGLYNFYCDLITNSQTKTYPFKILIVAIDWEKLDTNWQPYQAINGASCITSDNGLYILGGEKNETIWHCDSQNNWTEIKWEHPFWSARSKHAGVYFNNQLMIFGGSNNFKYLNDIWASSNGIKWNQLTENAPWSKRDGHACQVFKNQIWLMGGFDGERKNDIWCSSDGANWQQILQSAPWSGRDGHVSVVFQNKLWILGGYDGERKNDVWCSNDGIEWTLVTESAPWPKRDNHSAVVFDDKIWIMGGANDNKILNDVWYSSDGENWYEVKSNNIWASRQNHISAVFNNKIWVIGGQTDFRIPLNDIWQIKMREN